MHGSRLLCATSMQPYKQQGGSVLENMAWKLALKLSEVLNFAISKKSVFSTEALDFQTTEISSGRV